MQLLYRYDPGAGVCLWSLDDEARDRFGYAVSLEYLPLPSDTAAVGHDLISTFDGGIDWANPAGASLWTVEENDQFLADSARFFERLRTELGDNFELFTKPVSTVPPPHGTGIIHKS